MEDRLWAHPAYLKGAAGAVRVYLRLADAAAARGAAEDEEARLAAMSPEEAKK